MRGFTDKALILFSKSDVYSEGTRSYKCLYQLAVDNLLDYLQSIDVQTDFLITDQIAPKLQLREPNWITTGTREDIFFMTNFLGITDFSTAPLASELASEVRKKYKLVRGMSVAEQAKVVSARVSYIEKKLIANYKFVAVFGNQFRVKSVEGDGRAILRINEKNFRPSMELSGSPVPINIFLQRQYANLSLTEWGKYSE